MPIRRIEPMVADFDVSSEWWREGEFRSGPEWLKRSLNKLLNDECTRYQNTFERRIDREVAQAIEALVRVDTVVATRWTAQAELVRIYFQCSYSSVRSLSPIVLFAGAVWAVIEAPLWLRLVLIFITLSAAVLNVVPYEEGVSSAFIDALLLGVLVGSGILVIILLSFYSVKSLSVFGAIGSGICFVVVGLLVMWAADRLVARFVRALGAVLVLVFFCALVWAGWNYRAPLGRSSWFEYGLTNGLLLSLCVAAVFALLQFGLITFYSFDDLKKFRFAPEAEFVQSILWVVDEAKGIPESRASMVHGLEYLARLLEHGISAALGREDPESRVAIAEELGSRAAALREHKRAVLFGRPGSSEELLTLLDQTISAAAKRDWLALKAMDVGGQRRLERRAVRFGRRVLRLLLLLLPLLIAAVVWSMSNASLTDWLPAVLPFSVVWIAVNLAEIAKPGGGDAVEKAASNADKTASAFASAARAFGSPR